MAKKAPQLDTSTISDLLVKEWADHYPQEKVTSMLNKADSLSFTISSTQEQFTKLTVAKSLLDELSTPLSNAVSAVADALAKRQHFISTYGDLGVSLAVPPETITATLSEYTRHISDYALHITEAYFANLKDIESTIARLTSLRNLYRDLAAIATTIRKEYVPTQPDRRKPIIRELYRLFKAVADNTIFLGLSPTINYPLLPQTIDKDEYQSLCAARREAQKFAELLKGSR